MPIDPKHAERWSEAIVGLVNALEEWKNAGGDPIKVVGALQELNTAQLVQFGILSDRSDDI